MNRINTEAPRHSSYRPAPFLGSLPYPTGSASELLLRASASAIFLTTPSTLASAPRQQVLPPPLVVQLYNALAAFKSKTATVAMHFDATERARLFAQLDSLLAVESWDDADTITTEASFTTLLRMILFLDGRRPALGATSTGNFIATWTERTDRLTIECKPDDHVRWVLVQDLDGQRESAAGDTTVRRLPEVLRPYDSPKRWFPNADQTSA